MEKIFKRLLSFAIALFMALGMVPASVFAAEEAPELPTATVTELNAKELDLTFAMNFTADEATAAQLAYYGNWPADYVLTSNKEIVFNNNGSADGWLGGQYDGWSENWVTIPMDESVTLPANEPVRVMEAAMALMGYTTALTYYDIYDFVKSFNCGLYLDEEFLAANPDLEITLDLRMYNPEDDSESYAIGETYSFSAAPVYIGEQPYTTLQEAVSAAKSGDVIELVEDVVLTEPLVIPAPVAKRSMQTTTGSVVIDLAGQTISQSEECTASYAMITNYGDLVIIDSVGGGKISFTDTGAGDPTFGWGSYTILNRGTLTVNGGTIENLSAQNPGNGQPNVHMYCAIQQSAGSTTINDGTISTPTYRSVRINSGELIINGGTFEGQVWLQPNQGDTTLEITGGTFAPAGNDGSSVFMTNAGENYTVSSAAISGGTFTTKIGASDAAGLAGAITGGTFTASAIQNTNSALLAEGYEPVEDADGMYDVTFQAPELPTATVTELNAEELGLTFAMNFTADEVTEEQLEYYSAWPADYILTSNKDIVFNNDGSADGWLGGQYTAWSENWITVPMGESVTLPANTPVRVMETAMALMGYTTALTYYDIYDFVKSFNCGLYLDEEFLAANPDLEISLELRMYNPENPEESYAVGETYEFEVAPELPTATIKGIENENLTFAMNFKADKATDAQLDYYGDWYADYVLTINKTATFNADGGADGYLSGQYDGWSENWVNVPYGKGNVTLNAGEPVKIMDFAAELMGKPGLKYTYQDVYEKVKDFDCGIYFTEEFLAANPDLEVTLELRMYNPADETESYAIGESYVFTATTPELPTATATKIENDRLTFAMNFKADPATAAQLTYYGHWYADYVLTINKTATFNADGSADGFLSGQYDAWSENWVDVPSGKGNVTLTAGQELQIMKFAAELMGKTGLRYTYQEVYDRVKDFDCGVFFDEEFLAANPDLEVTLELRIYNPADETENYVIGDTYAFYTGTPELPTATVTEIENENLTFAMNFKADEATAAQLDYYGDWYADYVLTINKTATFNADGGADGWLSGQYDSWSENWVNVPYGKGNVTLTAGQELQIMKFAAELMGKTGLRYTYQEVYDRVKDFDCGVYFTEEFLAANPDLEVTLELRIYNNEDETESYRIGETYVFTVEQDEVAQNVQTGVKYMTVTEAMTAAQAGETVCLLKDVTGEKAENMILIMNEITLDLAGYTLEANYVVAVRGDARIMDSTDGEGLLKVAKNNLTLPGNDQLPYWIAAEGGFRFVTVDMTLVKGKQTAESLQLYYWFNGALDRADMRAELANIAEHELAVILRVSYTISDGSRAYLDIRVPDEKVVEYAQYDGYPSFLTQIKGLNNVEDPEITAYVVYDTVEVPGGNYEYVKVAE